MLSSRNSIRLWWLSTHKRIISMAQNKTALSPNFSKSIFLHILGDKACSFNFIIVMYAYFDSFSNFLALSPCSQKNFPFNSLKSSNSSGHKAVLRNIFVWIDEKQPKTALSPLPVSVSAQEYCFNLIVDG